MWRFAWKVWKGLQASEEKHEEFEGISDLWMKRWKQFHHPGYSMAYAGNPEYHSAKPWDEPEVMADVKVVLKRFFPDVNDRAVAEGLFSEYKKQEGFFTLVDEDGDQRAIWAEYAIKTRSPWSWWEDAIEPSALVGPFSTAAATKKVKVAKRFVWMMRRVLRIGVASSINERIFSNWKHILGDKRTQMGKKRQLAQVTVPLTVYSPCDTLLWQVNIYVNERVMKRSKHQRHMDVDSSSESGSEEEECDE